MDLQKPLFFGHLTGFSKPRAKTAKKPRSAALLREFVSFFKPSDDAKEVEHESFYSHDLLQGIRREGDIPETNATLTAGEAVSIEEEMHSVKKKQVNVSEKDNDMHARGKANNSLKRFTQKDNEESHFGRPYKKEDKPAAEASHARDLRVEEADRKGYAGSMEGRRSERYMKELLNREANQESAGRGKLKSKDERSDTARKEDSSTRLLYTQRGVHQEIQDTDQVGKNVREAPFLVGGTWVSMALS